MKLSDQIRRKAADKLDKLQKKHGTFIQGSDVTWQQAMEEEMDTLSDRIEALEGRLPPKP